MGRISLCPKTGLKRGAWTPEEDRLLAAYITRYGHWNWRELPKYAGLSRCGKSCRLRWMNYLRPNIKRGNYSKDEDELIIKMHHKLGNRWSAIAACLPGRTDNEIKNHWHTHLRKGTEQATTSNGVKQKLMNCETPKKREQVETLAPATLIWESSIVLPLSPQNSNDNLLSSVDYDSAVKEDLLKEEFTVSQDSTPLSCVQSSLNESFLVEDLYLPEYPSPLFSPSPMADSLHLYDVFYGCMDIWPYLNNHAQESWA